MREQLPKPTVFRRPARGDFGNAAKYVLRNPGTHNYNLSLFKNFPCKSEKFATDSFPSSQAEQQRGNPMKSLLIVVLSILFFHASAPGQTTPAPLGGNAAEANQWWAEAKALGQKAASLKKARYEATAKVNARISETATKEFIKRPSKPLADIYDELRKKAAPEFAAINQQYDPQITEAMHRYVAFLREPKLDDGGILVASMALRPEILYREKAKYTEAARQNRVQGTVLLSIIFSADGRITNVRVVRSLPDGMDDEAVKAASEIVFLPALKNGRPVSVRMSVEYSFNLL